MAIFYEYDFIVAYRSALVLLTSSVSFIQNKLGFKPHKGMLHRPTEHALLNSLHPIPGMMSIRPHVHRGHVRRWPAGLQGTQMERDQ